MTGTELLIASLVAGGATAASSIMSSIQQNEQLEKKAKIAEYQKGIAETNAGNARRISEVEGEEERRKSRVRLGEMRAAFGSNGIDLAGSPLDVLQDSAAEGELSAERREYAGKVQAVAYDQEAKVREYEASSLRKSKVSGLSMAFGALTTGVMTGLSIYGAGGGFEGFGGAGEAATKTAGNNFGLGTGTGGLY